MDTLTYRIDSFEGPLDLLLSLIQKSKYRIDNVPISLLCDQYLEYIRNAQNTNPDITADFLVMASELMLLKSRLLLPKQDEESQQAADRFLDVLGKHNQAKLAAPLLAKRYEKYSGRLCKDTDEITVDKTFVVDQDISSLMAAIRRIISYNETLENAKNVSFTPMIAKPIVPVEVKIVGIIKKIKTSGTATLSELIENSPSLPDTVAIFLGVLELIKTHHIVIVEDPDEAGIIHGENTRFVYNEEAEKQETQEETPTVTEELQV